ncbi:MAG: peptide-methionine (S)-S-oxide reductase MsrA [Gammaproteobacteria bacterium]
MKSKATFAAGCFWGVESTFRKIPGVITTRVGYTGGHTEDPSYRQVCGGQTGHAEAVEVLFDDGIISYEALLNVFWQCHTPTSLDRQGLDVGHQYRSAIFFHNGQQKSMAHASKIAAQTQFDQPIVTEITAIGEFYQAEEEHQRYLEKHGRD